MNRVMALTITKSRLLDLLKDQPDDAEIYVMATNHSVEKAVVAASHTVEKDVFLRLAANVLIETNGVSLVAYVD